MLLHSSRLDNSNREDLVRMHAQTEGKKDQRNPVNVPAFEAFEVHTGHGPSRWFGESLSVGRKTEGKSE